MCLFNKKNKKPECKHKYKTINSYECKHTGVFANEYVTVHYIQECKICHNLRHYSFDID